MSTDVVECEHCEHRWSKRHDGETVACPSCHRRTTPVVVGEELLLRGKALYLSCDDIDDMVQATERRLDLLRELRDEGYEVADPRALQDDYPTLRKIEGKNKRASLDNR